MRVVGGKPGPDGTLYTYIVWTMPGGPAEKARLRKGDKVRTFLEWELFYYDLSTRHGSQIIFKNYEKFSRY